MKDVKNVFNPKKRAEVEEQSSLTESKQSKKEEDSTSDSGQGSIEAGDLKSPNQNSKTNDDLSDMDLLTSDEDEVFEILQIDESKGCQPDCEDILSDEEWA